MNLPDIQKDSKDFISLPIDKVGVRGIKVPLKVLTKDSRESIEVLAKISSYCNLSDDLKGINMSRITQTIYQVMKVSNGIQDLNRFAFELKKAHKTDNIYIKASFPYWYEIKTPLSNLPSYESVNVIFESILKGDKLDRYLTVERVGMSLCPCSREMSLLKNNVSQKEMDEISKLSPELRSKLDQAGFGAHNQKSIVKVTVELNDRFYYDDSRSDEIFYIEDIIDIIDNSVSAPTWSTLKRPDEKFVTEVSYMGGYINSDFEFTPVENAGAKFVEDIGRNIADRLNKHIGSDILDYVIVVDNQESIHSDEIVATSILSYGKNLF